VRPFGALLLLPSPEQTALLPKALQHANAAVNASSASLTSVGHTTEAAVKRRIDTQLEPV
jgi:hypothetical protein